MSITSPRRAHRDAVAAQRAEWQRCIKQNWPLRENVIARALIHVCVDELRALSFRR